MPHPRRHAPDPAARAGSAYRSTERWQPLPRAGKALRLPRRPTTHQQRTADAVGRQLGVDTIVAELLPEDKAVKIVELQANGAKVAMVGDGVNDAPALAQADIGIAIGAGTELAVETADVVLVRDNPADVGYAHKIARAVRGKIKQNLFWAAIYNLLAIRWRRESSTPACASCYGRNGRPC